MCEAKNGLLEAYVGAANYYARIAADLRESALTQMNCREWRQAAEDARLAAQAARVALQTHTRRHGC